MTPIDRLQTALNGLGLKAVEARLERVWFELSLANASRREFEPECLNQRIAVAVPANATVEVISHTHLNRLVDVVWEGKRLRMFAQDIRERGEEVTDSK